MKKRGANVFLAVIFLLFLVCLLYDFSYDTGIEGQYAGVLYRVEEDRLVEIEDATVSLSGTQTTSLREGKSLDVQMTAAAQSLPQTACAFSVVQPHLVREAGWYSALPAGAFLSHLDLGPYTCNTLYFEKGLSALALPMDAETGTFLLVAAEDPGELDAAREIAWGFTQGLYY